MLLNMAIITLDNKLSEILIKRHINLILLYALLKKTIKYRQ